ncbi:MAG: pyridoxine 5'-phosphate synthase, partial [FCB group bacterium]|nr:pyridoxine 5'-phosphate synthase [FCB group bacterium]
EIDKEITTQSGLALTDDHDQLEEAARRLQEVGVKVGLLIDPSGEAVKRVVRMKVDAIKLFTGGYADSDTEEDGLIEMGRLERAARSAAKADMAIMAGQGLDYINLPPLARLGAVDEFIIGQSIISRSILTGMERAVGEMLNIARHDGSNMGL